MPLNDPELLGNVLRGVVALGIMMLTAGVAARLCRTRTSWLIASVVSLLLFAWLLLGVLPHPHQAGLLYSVQWGVFGTGMYAGIQALRAPRFAGRKPADPEQLLAFWFGNDLTSADVVAERSRQWFASDEAFDGEIRRRFGDWPERALEGEFDDWAESNRGALALVIALDQLPRNLHRGEPDGFAGDSRACEAALRAIDDGADRELHAIEAAFLYLPLEHAEDATLQARCVALFEQLCERGAEQHADQLAQYLDYAKRHRDVIDRFGRFPHRNATLGRESTEEETRWLADGGDRFGG